MQEIEFENDRSSNSTEFAAEVGCITVLVVVDRAGLILVWSWKIRTCVVEHIINHRRCVEHVLPR
jgi:hypothetical protein